MSNYEYDYDYEYDDDQDYIDGKEKRPKLILILGILMLIIIIGIIFVSCVAKNDDKSNNTNLSYIRVSNGTLSPSFNNSITNYKLDIEEDETIVSCSVESTKAKVEGCHDRLTLQNQTKEHSIKVTAEDGSVKVYKILISKRQNEKDILSVNIISDVESGKEVQKSLQLKAEVLPEATNINYEWYKDEQKLNEDKSEITVTESGEYYVKVIDKSTKKEVTSNIFDVNIKEKDKDKPSNNITNDTTTSNKNNYTLSISKVTGNSDKWVDSVTLYVEASTSNGLHSKAYSFDGGKTYQASNFKKFTKNQNVKIVVRDIKGNKVSKNVNITKIDTTIPKISISASDKTNKSVTLTANVTPASTASGYKYEWYKDGNKLNGITSSTYKATETGIYKVKITTGTKKSVASNEYKFNVVNIKCPVISAEATSGINISPKTWFNEVIYIKIIPSTEVKNYDVYLNEYGIFDKTSNNFTYVNTFTTGVKVKIVNNGLRMIKIVVRDKFGNSETCYSDVYYLK